MEVIKEDQRVGPPNIWVAQRVDTETIGSILAQLRQSPLSPYLTSPERLHATMVWLQETKKFLRILSAHTEQLDLELYRVEREQLLGDLEQMEGSQVGVPIKGIKYIGGSKRTVALSLEQSREMKKNRQPFVNRIMDFLSLVGVKSPKRMMQDHPLLNAALYEQHQPHITVARAHQPVDLPRLDLRGKLIRLSAPAVAYTPLDNCWHS